LTPTTIVLADDHAVVRQGLRALLEKEPGFSIVGEAADGLKVADLVKSLSPSVLVLDLMMPGLGGLDVTRQVVRRSPQTRIVILSMHANDAYVLEALRSGAAAYVLKDSSASELVRAIREVTAGRRYLTPPLSESAIRAYMERTKCAEIDPYEALTPREREVLHLAAEGLSSAEIAGRLGISPRTAESHRASVLRKLDLHSQTDLIRYAIRRGILPLDSDPMGERARRSRPSRR
jgi:two-component system, NarL family, response regulator NreC